MIHCADTHIGNDKTMASRRKDRDGAERQPFLLSKLAPPGEGRNVIRRERLDRSAADLWQRRCSVVVAPAGFGKTTMLSHWYRAIADDGHITAWLTCDRGDADPYRFARHLTRALALADNRLAKRLAPADIIDHNMDIASAGIAIVNGLETLKRPVLLVIDDFHHARGGETCELVSFLINSDCKFLHVVIASREGVDCNLSRLRLHDQVNDISAAELEFQAGEARDVVEKIIGRAAPPEAVEQIARQTQGWATGVRLAAMSLSESPNKPLDNLLTGKEPRLLDYLRDEVISRLDEELVGFVRQTAWLAEFSAELADHTRGSTDSQAMIDALMRRQLFIMPTAETGWYRYHPLFVDAFGEIAPGAAGLDRGGLHERAALWLEARGWIDRALSQARMSGSSDLLLRMLSAHAEELAHTGGGSTLLAFARELPAEKLRDHPDLQLDRVYAATLLWQFGEARLVLDQVRRSMGNEQTVADWRALGLNVERLEKKLIHREMQLLLLHDQMPQVERLALQWQSMGGDNTPFEDAVTRTTLVYAQREMFNCSGVWTAKEAREIFEAEDNRWATIWHDCIIGASHALMGRLDRAERTISRAFHTSEGLLGRQSPTTAMPALYLAELRFERNELDTARALIDEFLPLATQTGLVDQLIAGYKASAKLAALDDRAAAIRILERGEEVASARQFERLRAILLSERISMLAAAGENSAVRRIAKLNNLPTNLERLKPRDGQSTLDAIYAFASAQVAICENELDDAEWLLQRWAQFLETRQCVRFAIRFALVLAHAQVLKGEANAAHRTIRNAIQLAGDNGFVRSFADANPAIRGSLTTLSFEHQPELKTAHARIVAAIDAETGAPKGMRDDLEIDGGQYEALNDRESEILLMISTGRMNKQIAAELGLTLGTVKWYLQQIYTKMGVNRRSEAVFKARQLGLIA